MGYIIETVSGESYAKYLQDNIFQPLNMVNTGYDDNRLVLKDRASGYRRLGADEFRNADYIDMSIPYAAGGLYSTVEDLHLWDRALYTEALVSQSSLDMIFTPFVDMPDMPGEPHLKYGYGWMITELLNRKAIGHGGQINGFVSDIVRFVDDDVVVLVWSNIENAPLFVVIEPGLFKIVFGEE